MISSKEQTKDWRKSQDWYINGKKNECELYQKDQFEQITQQPIRKTLKRLFMLNHTMVEISNPLKGEHGFEYTENFDGEFRYNDTAFLVNFKFTCDLGGAQLRTLREVYHFIKTQLEYLKSQPDRKVFFINVLDGNTAFQYRNQFSHLKHPKVFIGDMKDFSSWWEDYLNKANTNS